MSEASPNRKQRNDGAPLDATVNLPALVRLLAAFSTAVHHASQIQSLSEQLVKDRQQAAHALEALLAKLDHTVTPPTEKLTAASTGSNSLVAVTSIASGVATDTAAEALKSALAGCQSTISALTAVNAAALKEHTEVLVAAWNDLSGHPNTPNHDALSLIMMLAAVPKAESKKIEMDKGTEVVHAGRHAAH